MLEDVGLDVAEGGLRAVLDAVGEGLQNLVLEVRARVGGGDLGALLVGELVVVDAEDVELDPDYLALKRTLIRSLT